jgi:PPOX class probable F420-dependent enzyme
MAKISGAFQELLGEPVLYNLATLNPDGSLAVNPVWGELHEGNVRINTAAGRQKHKNMEERGDHVTVIVLDPANSQRYVEIRGRVAQISDENGDEVINGLANKYMGVDTYPFKQPGEVRVTILIEPTKVLGQA